MRGCETRVRTHTFVYIDEAQDYLDEHCEALFNSARKYKVGLYVAHQNLGQLGDKLKQSIMASTSTKLAGGVSARDASAFSQEMRCSSDFIQETRKRQDHTEFACWVKHMTPQAIKITVPLGSVEKLPVIPDADYAALIEENRRRYCTSAEAIAAKAAELETALPVIPREHEEAEPLEEVPPALPKEQAEEHKEAKPTAPGRKRGAPRDIEPPAPLGGGGKEHKYLQNLIKQVGHDRGFRAVIEHEILDGRGRVDVSLEREELRVACEISVTSTVEQELGNVAKCLAAGYDEIVVIASEPKRLRTLERFVSANLGEEDKERVRFFVPEAFIAYLDEIEAAPETREEVVRGYKVSVTHVKVDAAEAQERRKTAAKVIARSYMKDEPSSAP